MNFNEENYCDLDLRKGNKIKIIGTISTTDKIFIFIISKIYFISKISSYDGNNLYKHND